uniref:Cytochrome P450 3075A5 n=1 Tax=Paracyclopina nana TaxID=565004 RepID=A0A0F7J2S9_PARNA|nr:cytochrome P450 3075A5 [Paracyclopina nana]
MAPWLIAFLACLLAYFWKCKTSKPKSFPPGPARYPILGSAMSLQNPKTKKPELFYGIRKLQQEYGSIFGFYLGNQSAVAITKFEDIKEILSKSETAHRPPVIGLAAKPGKFTAQEVDPELNKDNPPGIILSNGRYWSEQRRFMLKTLREFGFGKSSMEAGIQEDVKMLIDHLALRAGKPTEIGESLNIAIINSLWSILVGEKLKLNDPKLEMVVKATNDLITSEGPTGLIANLLPHKSMIYWPFFKQVSGYSLIESIMKKLEAFMLPYIENHQNSDSYIDEMLREIAKTTDKTSSFYGERGQFALINNVIDLFMAGVETTSSSLLWSFLYLLHYPECQAKIQEELDRVCGSNRLPNLDDKPSLHYTNAFLQESLRLTCFVPLSVFHFTSEDVTVHGYVIPEKTMVIPSLYHVMHDPDHFPEPGLFKPDRFLDENGHFMANERVIPFGVGRRICLGKSLAEKELFLFFTGILQRFSVLNVPGVTPPPFGIDFPMPGIVRNVPRFQLVLQ